MAGSNSKITQVVDGQKVEIEIVAIDPEFAQALLDTMVINRGLKKKTKDGMVREMHAGQFPFCADPIRINDRGELDDGEHRLTAIVESGTTQNMLIAWGMAPENRIRYDSGTSRRPGDQVRIVLKRPNTAALAAISSLLIRWRAGDLVSQQLKPTIAEQFAFIEQNLDILQVAQNIQESVRRGVGVNTSSIGASFVTFHRINPAEAEKFYETLASGEGLKVGQPVHTLRQALTLRQKPEHWSQTKQVFAHVRMWNAQRRGETMGKLQFPAGGWSQEHFIIR